MKLVISVVSVLAFVLPLDGQILASLDHQSGRLPEIRVRNKTALSVAAFAVRMEPLVRDEQRPFLAFFDTVTDMAATPLLPGQERTIPVPVRFRAGQAVEELFKPDVVFAGILDDGGTTGDPVLLARLMSRRSNMLLAVETALETLLEAGGRNVRRTQLTEQFRKLV